MNKRFRILLVGFIALALLLAGTVQIASAQGVTVTTTASLRLREGPGTTFAILTTIPAKTTLEATGRNEDKSWVFVKFEGFTGWVSVRYVRVKGSLASLPVVATTGGGSGSANALPNDVTLVIINELGVRLYLNLNGPARFSFVLAAGETRTVNIPAGTYRYSASASGFNPTNGTETWSSGERTEWRWFAN